MLCVVVCSATELVFGRRCGDWSLDGETNQPLEDLGQSVLGLWPRQRAERHLLHWRDRKQTPVSVNKVDPTSWKESWGQWAWRGLAGLTDWDCTQVHVTTCYLTLPSRCLRASSNLAWETNWFFYPQVYFFSYLFIHTVAQDRSLSIILGISFALSFHTQSSTEFCKFYLHNYLVLIHFSPLLSEIFVFLITIIIVRNAKTF